MNRPPSILINTGFPVDQNGALTEIVVPAVVSTLNAPRKITFLGETLNYIPSTAAALQEFIAPNVITLQNQFNGFGQLISARFDSVTSISSTTNWTATFNNCIKLVDVYFPALVSITSTANGGAPFIGCSALVSVTLDSLTTTYNTGGVFVNCTGLINLALPKIKVIAAGANNSTGLCAGCTALQTVQLGSEGNPVTSIGNYSFSNCTQTGLTITIYTQGGAALSGEPWGATNATIEYEEA